jgi:hypothetical protein
MIKARSARSYIVNVQLSWLYCVWRRVLVRMQEPRLSELGTIIYYFHAREWPDALVLI